MQGSEDKGCLIPALAYAPSQAPGALEKFRPEGMGLRWELGVHVSRDGRAQFLCPVPPEHKCTASLLCLPLPDHVTFGPTTSHAHSSELSQGTS